MGPPQFFCERKQNIMILQLVCMFFHFLNRGNHWFLDLSMETVSKFKASGWAFPMVADDGHRRANIARRSHGCVIRAPMKETLSTSLVHR